MALSAKADEGMWMIGNLSEKTQKVLKEMGLELAPEQIYNPNGPSLNNAIVMFGGFCSGVVVSKDGLVFTNHHCGFDAIQDHSTVKNDYLKNGFFAKKLKDELPNPELYVAFHLSTVDVTDKILAGVKPGMDEMQKAMYMDSFIDQIIEDTLSCLLAGAASDTATDILVSDLDDLSFNTFIVQHF